VAVVGLFDAVLSYFFEHHLQSCNCLGGKHRNFGKIAGKLPVIAFRAMNLIFVVGTATAGTARQLPVNGA
jgi:hypothetical protein